MSDGRAPTGARSRAPTRARDNPFATDRLEALGYRSPRTGEPVDLEPLLARWESLGRRAAIVGPEGSGKTTLLDELEPILEARGHAVRRLRAEAGSGVLVEERSRQRVVRPEGLTESDGHTILVVDGADRLKRRIWRRLRRASGRGNASRAGGLLVTSHRTGLLPTLTECATSPELLERLVADLVGSGPAAPDRPLPPAAILHARHRGNLRLALLELYDRWAEPSIPSG